MKKTFIILLLLMTIFSSPIFALEINSACKQIWDNVGSNVKICIDRATKFKNEKDTTDFRKFF